VSAPELFACEVANALWKHTRAGDLDSDEVQVALEYSLELVDVLEPSVDLAPEALVTASAHDHPVYDALYAVLARRSGATVCTFDRRLTKLLDVMVVPYLVPRG
jgi:predicted nucleic acid-binding protein